MAFSKEQVLSAVQKALQDKETRKFTQTAELSVNFRGIDFNKAEHRLNLEILLPKGRGKAIKIVVFADSPIATEAKAAGADLIISSAEVVKYTDTEVKALTKNSEFLAQPQLMMVVGKKFGQILGGRGKVPKPLVGNVAASVKAARSVVKIKSRGKNLPTVHCPIGTEKMSPEDITDNAVAVLSAITNKVGDYPVASVYVKLTMGKPVKIE